MQTPECKHILWEYCSRTREREREREGKKIPWEGGKNKSECFTDFLFLWVSRQERTH